MKPLGFSVEDRYLKRAGLDYWHLVTVHYHENFSEVLQQYQNHTFYFNTTKASRLYTQVQYKSGDMLVFGKETAGIPESILKEHWDDCIRIPMISESRSLNLSNSVAVIAYEAMRQLDYANLKQVGFDHLD